MMRVSEVEPGLWRWTVPHPEWVPGGTGPEDWPQEVGGVYCEGPDAVLLVDPLLPAPASDERERFWRALDGDLERLGLPLAVVVTLVHHERSAAEIADRYGARVLAEERTAPSLERREVEPFRAGDALPGGALSLDAHKRGEVLVWIPAHGALVAGDVLVGTPDGGVAVCPDSWLAAGLRGAALRAALRPLLDLPVRLVLPAHGEPVLSGAAEALARALAP